MDPLDVFHETPKQSAGPSGGEEISAPGWDAITEAFQTLYPGQEHPLHFGVLIPWQLGGPNPLQGVSAYDGGDFFHLVTYGLTDLYEKEGTDPDYSGYGYEFTMKLRKAGLEDVHAELHCAAGILQDLAKLTFEKGEQFYPNEYIYTGQTTGMDMRQVSKLTGFITAWDEAGTIETPNGKVDFVQLIGATDPELRAVMDGTLRVAELAERLGGWTDYTRDSTV